MLYTLDIKEISVTRSKRPATYDAVEARLVVRTLDLVPEHAEGGALVPLMESDEQVTALKLLEEAAEAYGEWQIMPMLRDGTLEGTDYFADELADTITACVNLADRYGLDLQAALDRVEAHNRERGRYE